MAAAKKRKYLKRYGHPETAAGWHFLTGQQPAIDALTKAVGFGYVPMPGPDGKLTQFAHASSIQIVTPEGKLAQYYLGVEYSPKDMLLGLVEASDHKIGSPVDNILTYCYHYDPTPTSTFCSSRAWCSWAACSQLILGVSCGHVPPRYQEQPSNRKPTTFSEGVKCERSRHSTSGKRNG